MKEWTTRPDFSSPLVDHLPKVAGIPSPKDILGHYIGEPKKLTYYADILTYYRALAAKSPRVKVLTIGKTDEGRELVVVFVGSEESIKNLEQYRTYLGQLADPRRLSDAQAKEIIAKAKPIYHVIGGLHSGEVGPSEMLMELAYRVATEDSPIVKQIRDNVIVSITPVADPDGRDRNVDWYYKYGIHEPADGRGNGSGRAVLGQVRLPRRQPRHQLLADGDARAARLVPAVASADHARPASGADAALHVQRPGAAESDARSDSLRRDADDGEFRDGAVREIRHARRVDARLRGHVVAGLSRVHVVEPQRHHPDVRDSGVQRREHAAHAPRRRWRRGAGRRACAGGGAAAASGRGARGRAPAGLQHAPRGVAPRAATSRRRAARSERRRRRSAAARARASGTARFRPPESSTGRCATTRTTAKPAC